MAAKASGRLGVGEQYPFDSKFFGKCDISTGEDYLALISQIVSTHENKKVDLKPHGTTWTVQAEPQPICSRTKVKELGQFYLPEEVNMVVLGILDTPDHCGKLLFITCENKQLYAYDGDKLHLVGKMMQLLRRGVLYPGSKSFYRGEAFKDMTVDDWEELRKGEVGKTSEENHLKFVMEHKPKMMEYLSIVKPHVKVPDGYL